MGCSSGSNARYFTNVLVGLRAPSEALTPCELVNSVMISPQPSRLRMKRRNTVSVTPAMGARTVAGAIRTLPIAKLVGNSRIKFGLLDFNGWRVETELSTAPSLGLEEFTHETGEHRFAGSGWRHRRRRSHESGAAAASGASR